MEISNYRFYLHLLKISRNMKKSKVLGVALLLMAATMVVSFTIIDRQEESSASLASMVADWERAKPTP